MKKINKEKYLIGLCWLVYTCSYIGRLSYNSNISQIGNEFNLSYSQTGLVTTFFFFAYGIGQVVNGIFCKKYNIKYIIFSSLIVSSIANILLVNINNPEYFKYIWMINGISMSFLWTSLIRLLSENISKERIGQAIVVMGTTVAIGTFLIYGISSIFTGLLNYRYTFYLASILLIVVAIVWIVSFNKLAYLNIEIEEKKINTNNDKISSLGFFIVVLAVFAVINNFIKDVLPVWTADILDSLYDTDDWLSIFLTLFLPMLAVMGTIVAVNLNKKIKNFVTLCEVLYSVALVLIILVVVLIYKNMLIVTLSCFALTSCLMASVNNVITSMIPLKLKDRVNSGKLAGILNGFCYLGSTLSAYGLGIIADNFGWNSVFITILCVLVIGLILGCIYILTRKGGNNNEKDIL